MRTAMAPASPLASRALARDRHPRQTTLGAAGLGSLVRLHQGPLLRLHDQREQASRLRPRARRLLDLVADPYELDNKVKIRAMRPMWRCCATSTTSSSPAWVRAAGFFELPFRARAPA